MAKNYNWLKRKEFIPMSTLTVLKKIKETNFPEKDKFFSSLGDCGIIEKVYQGARNVWKVLKIKDLGQ